MRDSDGMKKEIHTIFAIPSGKRLCQLPFDQYTLSWSFSADESRAAFFEWETGKIHVHDTATGKLLWQFGGEDAKWKWVWSTLALSPDGNMLAAQVEDAPNVQIWDLRTGKHSQSLVLQQKAQHSDAACLAWSPDSRMLAVGGLDNSIRLWEVSTAKVRREFVGHVAQARILAFSPDGQLLASGSDDTTMLIWKLLADK
jgi:WD40 repeat protein